MLQACHSIVKCAFVEPYQIDPENSPEPLHLFHLTPVDLNSMLSSSVLDITRVTYLSLISVGCTQKTVLILPLIA